MKINKILVLFKTHLDIGFTDFAKNVVDKYMNVFIPNAIKVSNELREEGGVARFKWTTGSWLIHEYLRTRSQEEVKALTDAINCDGICWHGLPFTTHTELMSGRLFEYGLSLSKELDARFSKTTIGAKMTDVPGHTKAMIPYLHRAGIEFLHIGVNPASAVPEIPDIFRWRADTGEEITVMYNYSYGAYTPIGDSGTAIYFAHTNDNQGGQSAEQVKEIFARLEEEFPGAELVAADLNDVALAIREIKDSLPIVTDEIGASWIHGIGTDPGKIAMFKAFERLAVELEDKKDRDIINRAMLMVCEHTWGFNGQIKLGDHKNYLRRDFDKCRELPNFKRMEASWAEQRAYLTDTLAELSDGAREKALAIISSRARELTDISSAAIIKPKQRARLAGFEIAFDKDGSIIHLENGGRAFADDGHRLAVPMYEQFSADEYNRFFSQYNRLDILWAREDFTKIGLDKVRAKYQSYTAKAKIYMQGEKIIVRYAFPKRAFDKCGCPRVCEAVFSADADRLFIDFSWFDKPANRMTEAFWLGFEPIAANKRIQKLSWPIDPSAVVCKGNRRLHGTDFGVIYDEITIEALDSALVAPAAPSILNFTQESPRDEEGVHFNLYNNMWNTNFPMWYEEDAKFRFVITVKQKES